ncbi:DUF2000 domain-containing protein [Niallia sp. 01092]|uniref:DUF2000 domain-containing protein n=1 Tax=unclassified Niallia TaxID=2837522 RepID=UPI003FD328E1
MDLQNKKCVMVIDSELPIGLIANTSAVLALTVGKKIEGLIGPAVVDGEGQLHEGITNTPIPILKGSGSLIKLLRDKVAAEFPDLLLVDFSNVAQISKHYDDYTAKIASSTINDLRYLGIALYGEKKSINKLTGSLPLLR